ncbi:MAG TPA: ubiquinol-cytochrome c reductase cytochrome b subunit [Actinomycetota bacterium]|nr:ubiquinol-cytochrome c reductase cytochrome b subunit [Actinomycetota bacterium]
MIARRLARRTITRRLVRGLDDRLRFASAARTGLAKIFPDHWSFMLGEIALYGFVVLILTGIYVTFFFQPSLTETVYHGRYAPLAGTEASAAYASTVRLSWDVRMGLVMRQAHHWAALIFLAAIVAHLARIFFTGAFRRPREINWLVGLTMLLLAIFNGFSGYSLPDDLLSGVGLRIGYGVMLSIPVVGSWIAFLLFGGEFPADEIIHRFYVLHILVVPAAIAILLSAHIFILIRQKHSDFPGPGRREHNVVGSKFWPTYTLRSVSLLCAVLAASFALGGLVQINPIWLYGPFDPSAVTGPAQPDWYVGWLEGALRVWPSWELRASSHTIPNPFVPAVALPAVTFLLLYAWPFLEQWANHDLEMHQLLDRPRDHPVRLGLGLGVGTFYGLLLAAASNDLIARQTHWSVGAVTWAFRVGLVVVPPLVGAVAFVLARALKRSGAAGLMELSWSEVRLATRRARVVRPEGGHGVAPEPGRLSGEEG